MADVETIRFVPPLTPRRHPKAPRTTMLGRSVRPGTSQAIGWGVGLLALCGAIGLQTQLYSGQVRTVTTVFMYVGLAAAWNLIGGYAGYASFGHVGFFGLGGYTAAVAMVQFKWSFWVTLPLAGLVAGCLAALLGWPLLRLKGHYFAVATLGVGQGLRELVVNTPDATGGGAGITLPTTGNAAVTTWLGNDGFYVLFLVLAALAVAVGGIVASTRLGYALRAIHQDEDAAASVGVNTTAAKTIAFAGSAAITGAIGAAFAFQQITIYPDRMFDIGITVLMVCMVVLGGSGTVAGPVIGAVLLAFGQEWLRSNITHGHEFVLGALIIVAVILMPQGITNYARDAVTSGRYSLLDNVRRYRL